MQNPLLSGLLDLVFPTNCILCRSYAAPREGQTLCDRCRESIQVNRPPFCQRCSRPLTKAEQTMLCPTCRHNEYAFDHVWAASLYRPPLDELVHLFKYHQKTGLRHLFSEIMLNFLKLYQITYDDYDMMVCVPLHPVRLRERGYNQSQLLAEELNRSLNLEPAHDAIKRTRHTQPQTQLDRKQRWTNTSGAFTITHPEKIEGRSVVVVDDLITTGATISHIAAGLKEAGAKKVAGLALAIA